MILVYTQPEIEPIRDLVFDKVVAGNQLSITRPDR